jgi:hypothetical protein
VLDEKQAAVEGPGHDDRVLLPNCVEESAAQRVRIRLDTAHGHILLSDRHTAEQGLAMLTEAADRSTRYGLSHQLAAITTIRNTYQRHAR